MTSMTSVSQSSLASRQDPSPVRWKTRLFWLFFTSLLGLYYSTACVMVYSQQNLKVVHLLFFLSFFPHLDFAVERFFPSPRLCCRKSFSFVSLFPFFLLVWSASLSFPPVPASTHRACFGNLSSSFSCYWLLSSFFLMPTALCVQNPHVPAFC